MMEIGELTVVQLRAALNRGEFSCAEYAGWVISQLKATEDINAISWADEEAFLEGARRIDRSRDARRDDKALAGIPIALKDNIDTVDLPTTAGTPSLRGFQPRNNAAVAQTLFDAGALLAGKANMHELAFGITSNNTATGAVRNPWNRTKIAGGSSGGSAAAVSARIVPASLGTDTGASVRLPAALCGVIGFRPTLNRYSSRGVVPISHTRDTVGPIARAVEDIILLDQVLVSGHAKPEKVNLKGLRFGVPRSLYENASPRVLTVVGEALANLRDAGAHLIDAEIPSLRSLNESIGFPIALYEVVRDIPKYLQENHYALTFEEIVEQIASPDVAAILGSQLGADAVAARAYQQALGFRVQLQDAYARYFADHRLEGMLFPTSLATASPLGDDETFDLDGKRVPTFPTFIHNTDPGSNVGIPGISLPAGLANDGLPVGIELDGPIGGDQRLLAIAQAIETVLPRMPRP